MVSRSLSPLAIANNSNKLFNFNQIANNITIQIKTCKIINNNLLTFESMTLINLNKNKYLF